VTQAQGLAVATSDAQGNISITFKSQNVNSTFTGTVSVPTAPLGAKWQVLVNGTSLATMLGPSSYPVQLGASDVLVLVGTNTTPNTQYQGVLQGIIQIGDARGLVPNQSQVAIAAQQPSLPIGSGVSIPAATGPTPGSVVLTLTTDPSWRSISLLCAQAPSPLLYFTILGAITGAAYSQGSSTIALGVTAASMGPFGLVTIPINAAWDTTITVTLYNTDSVAREMWLSANTTDTVTAAYGGVPLVDVVANSPVLPVTLLAQPGVFATTIGQRNPVTLGRSDGRAYPIGALFVGGVFGGSGVLIAAPGSGVSILLDTIFIACTTAGAPLVTATKNGATVDIVQVTNVGQTAVIPYPGGLLLDAATAVNFVAGGGGAAFIAIAYDEVN
jgi:hypothetical protein